MGEEERDTLELELLSNSSLFASSFLRNQCENSWYHNVIYAILDNELTQENGKIVFNRTGKINKKILIFAPRNFAKTTTVTVNHTIKEIYRNRSLRYAIVSATGELARGFLREIRNHLETNRELIDFFGNLRDDASRWTDSYITVKRNFKGKDPSVVALGAREAILSRRADVIVLDDILSPENTKDKTAVDKIKYWWSNVLEPTLEPNGRVIAVGTKWSNEDLYADFMGDPAFDIKITFRSLMSAEDILNMFSDEVIEAFEIPIPIEDYRYYFDQGVVDSMAEEEDIAWKPRTYNVQRPNERITELLDYCSLWPARWKYEDIVKRLESIRQVAGSASFLRQYMNIVTDVETEFVNRKWLVSAKDRGKDMTFWKTIDRDFNSLGGQVFIVAGVDLAISLDESADYFAMVTIAVRKSDGHRFLLNMVRGRFTPSEQRRIIKSQYDAFEHDLILVESNGYQAALQKDMAEQYTMPIKAYLTSKEKYDPVLGVNSIAVLLENEKFTLPYSKEDRTTQELIDILCNGLIKFSPELHTEDSVMALWFANTAARMIERKYMTKQVSADNSIVNISNLADG